MFSRIALRIGALILLLSTALPGQISQDHPELCGTQSPVALPLGLTAQTDRSSGVSTLAFAAAEGVRSIRLPGVQNEIQQVCPISGNRLVVFGAHDGYTVHIVELRSGTVVDSFPSYSPVMSPDGRWLAMRVFHATQTEFPVSEQYTLYDLTRSAQSNRHGSSPYTSEIPGEAVYPVTATGAPANIADVPDSSRHEFRSSSFYWSADSRYLAFADSVGKSLSIVLVSIDGDKIGRFVHGVAQAEVCAERAAVMQGAQIYDSAGAGTTVVTKLNSEGNCKPKDLTLTMSDFKRAAIEEHEPIKRKPAVKTQSSGKRESNR